VCREALLSIAPAVASYIDSLAELSLVLEPGLGEEFAHFALLCLEVGRAMMSDRFSPRELDIVLICARAILRHPVASRSLASCKHNYRLCSGVSAVDSIVRNCCGENLPSEVDLECSGLREAMADNTTREFGVACARMAALVNWLERRSRKENSIRQGDDVPNFLAKSLESIIISLARQPLVNSFVLTPPLLWKHGSPIVGTGPSK
jgi:huntingtin